jgi:hypothetical protein
LNAQVPVPFGKYEGQPVDVLISDEHYVEWLTSQPWFAQRYPVLHQTVVNYGAAPQDSPEHNHMQARFLDHAVCLAVARVAAPMVEFDEPVALQGEWETLEAWRSCRTVVETRSPAEVVDLRFEDHGWDVTFAVRLPCLEVRAEGQDHDGQLVYGGDDSPRFCIELKPDLGDDFPDVLRQVQRYPAKGTRIVVVRRAEFAQVTVEQVKAIFAADQIALISEREG